MPFVKKKTKKKTAYVNGILFTHSATGVCTRTATEQDGYTEEYCCPGYSGNPPNCTRECKLDFTNLLRSE